MIARQDAARARGRWPALLLVAFIAFMAFTGCGPSQRFFHDARYTPDGTAIEMAALMPNCGCVSITNLARAPERPDPERGTGVIELVSMTFGAERGIARLAPGQTDRIKYDWSGPDDQDRYQIWAYAVRPDGRRGARLTPISRYVELGQQSESTCRGATCTFGLLHMDRAVHGSMAQGEIDHRRRGVDYTSAGQLLEAVASPQTCGCMLIQNVNPERGSVHVQASFAGTLMGRVEIPWTEGDGRQPVRMLGFDWGGPLGRESYVLSVVGLGNRPDDAADVMPSGSVSTRLLRLQDYINVVGQVDQLDCAPEGATVWLPAPEDPSQAQGGLAVQPAYPVTCPFDVLNMSRMVRELGTKDTLRAVPLADAPGSRRAP